MAPGTRGARKAAPGAGTSGAAATISLPAKTGTTKGAGAEAAVVEPGEGNDLLEGDRRPTASEDDVGSGDLGDDVEDPNLRDDPSEDTSNPQPTTGVITDAERQAQEAEVEEVVLQRTLDDAHSRER